MGSIILAILALTIVAWVYRHQKAQAAEHFISEHAARQIRRDLSKNQFHGVRWNWAALTGKHKE